MPTSQTVIEPGGKHRASSGMIVFGGLCLLQGSYWLLPDPESTWRIKFNLTGLVYLLLGLVGLVFSRLRKGEPKALLEWVRIGAWGLMLVAVPEILLDIALRSISSPTVTAGLALVPVVVSVALQQRESEGRALTPALAAAGGLLLLLPFHLDSSRSASVAVLALVGAVASIGMAGVFLHRGAHGWRMSEVVGACGLSNGVLLLLFRHCVGVDSLAASTTVVGGGLDGIGLLLLLWLTREMKPLRVSTRFLFVPIVTVLEGAVMMRPQFTLRSVTGLHWRWGERSCCYFAMTKTVGAAWHSARLVRR